MDQAEQLRNAVKTMNKNKNKKNIKDSAIKDFAKENERMRNERIAGTNNGMTLRTRSIPNKKKYTRKQKHSNKDFE